MEIRLFETENHLLQRDSIDGPGLAASRPGETAGHSAPINTSGRGWGATLFQAAVLALVFGAGWLASNARHEQAGKQHLPAETESARRDAEAVVVTVEPVAPRAVQRVVEALGTLHGFEEVTISSKIEGRVRRVFHDVSDQVKPSELLLEIEPTDFELAVQQADRAMQVELAKLGLKAPPDQKFDLTKIPVVMKAKSTLEHAKSRLDRITRLAASKNVSAEESESAAAEFRTSSAEYDNQIIQAESGLATIQMKQVEIEVARDKFANTKISAPVPTIAVPGTDQVAYVVSQRMISEGTLVRPGTEVFRVVIGQTLKLRVPVPERHSSDIEVGQKVQVFAAAAAKPYAGSVTRIYPTVDSSTRTFQVEVQVPNPHGELKPGSFAKAAILTRIDSQAMTVPLSALVQFAGITKIFLADSGKAKEVPVTLGTQTTEWVEIEKPVLPEGAQVITSGQMTIANETPISVRDVAKPVTNASSTSGSKPGTEPANQGTTSVETGIRE